MSGITVITDGAIGVGVAFIHRIERCRHSVVLLGPSCQALAKAMPLMDGNKERMRHHIPKDPISGCCRLRRKICGRFQ